MLKANSNLFASKKYCILGLSSYYFKYTVFKLLKQLNWHNKNQNNFFKQL